MTLDLSQIVERYLALGGSFGKPVALNAFGLSREETERVFSALDEDYHISRFFHFSRAAAASADSYQINGFPHTHVSLDAEVRSIL